MDLKPFKGAISAAEGRGSSAHSLVSRLAKEDVPMDGGAELVPVHAIPQSRRLREAYIGLEPESTSVRSRDVLDADREPAPVRSSADEEAANNLAAAAQAARDIRPVELVQDCISGGDGAWETFVSRYSPLIHAIARRSLRSRGLSPAPDDLDDICENTILALVRDDFALLRSYDDRYALSTFVGVVARTQAGRFARRRRIGGSDVDVAELPSRCEDPALAVEENDLRAALRETLDEMPIRDRQVLRLFYFSDRDYREIAAELRISSNSVGAALHRARERLRARLEARGQG
jgi:RNA polymerase sigma-70 factor (ECF subfamily)